MANTKEQIDLEQPVKGYQLKAVTDEMKIMNQMLSDIKTQTSGIVTRKEMEDYVEKEIANALAPFVAHRNNVVKVGWLLLTLIITDLATRFFRLHL